jgi:hypothetical protein
LNAQAIKVAVRMSQHLDNSFNHYAVSAENRYKPYYVEAEKSWDISGLTDPYETISLYQLFDLYIQVLEETKPDVVSIRSALPDSWKDKTVNRGMFANITQAFDTLVNNTVVDQ